jgi:translation initiation factor 2 subunit 3
MENASIDSSIKTITVNYSDIISKQAVINIGTIGHVSHGKTTTVAQLTGERTQRHEGEITSNRTIYIGYANSKIWRCSETGETCCTPSTITHKISKNTGKPMQLIAHISFVDCPGHADFMCTMIGGTSAMDAVFLLIAANDTIFPQAQTYEHLLAMATTNVNNYLILQNKLDLVTPETCNKNYNNITNFIVNSPAEGAPIVPCSAQLGQNMDVIGKYIINGIPEPNHDPNKDFKMFIIRSFDNNKPNTSYKKLIGGTIGGSIVQGTVCKDDYIEIRPGFIYQHEGNFVCQPIVSKVTSLFCGKEPLDIAFPGGLKAIGMQFDPSLSKHNGLAGQIAGTPGTLPSIYESITFEYKTLNKKVKKLKKMKVGEEITICVNAKTIPATVINVEAGKVVVVKLSYPVCIDTSLNMTIMRRSDKQLIIHSVANFLSGDEVKNIVYSPKYNEIKENIPKRHININYDINFTKEKVDDYIDYTKLTDNITFTQSTNKKNDQIRMVYPEVVNMNRVSIISNFSNIMTSFDSKSRLESADDHIQKMIHTLHNMDSEMINVADFLQIFIRDELNTTSSIDERNQLILRGFYRDKQIEGVMQKFVTKFSLCTNCNSCNTLVTKQKNNKSKIMSITCLRCSAKTSIKQ